MLLARPVLISSSWVLSLKRPFRPRAALEGSAPGRPVTVDTLRSLDPLLVRLWRLKNCL
jgi:hypothetical protein